MTKAQIVQRLIEQGHITTEEAVILLHEVKETITVPYHINNEDDKGIWYSTVS